MKVSCNIDEVIDFLQKKKEEGYESVELLDDSKAAGWFFVHPTLEFVFNKNYPKTLCIDARTSKTKK